MGFGQAGSKLRLRWLLVWICLSWLLIERGAVQDLCLERSLRRMIELGKKSIVSCMSSTARTMRGHHHHRHLVATSTSWMGENVVCCASFLPGEAPCCAMPRPCHAMLCHAQRRRCALRTESLAHTRRDSPIQQPVYPSVETAGNGCSQPHLSPSGCLCICICICILLFQTASGAATAAADAAQQPDPNDPGGYLS